MYSKGLKRKKTKKKNKKHNKMIIHWDAFWDWGTEANSISWLSFHMCVISCLTSSNPCECSILHRLGFFAFCFCSAAILNLA